MNDLDLFISELTAGLAKVPKGAADDVIQYYREYFDDARQAGRTDEEILARVGTAGQVIASILDEISIQSTQRSPSFFGLRNLPPHARQGCSTCRQEYLAGPCFPLSPAGCDSPVPVSPGDPAGSPAGLSAPDPQLAALSGIANGRHPGSGWPDRHTDRQPAGFDRCSSKRSRCSCPADHAGISKIVNRSKTSRYPGSPRNNPQAGDQPGYS